MVSTYSLVIGDKMRLARRALFWTLSASLFLARFGQAMPLDPATADNVSATVAIVQSDGTASDLGDIESMVRQAVRLTGGLEDLIEAGDVVVIKPNLVLDESPETGMVTDARIVRALVRLAQELNAGQVYIAEGSARYSVGDPNRDRYVTRHAFQVAGYDLDGDMVDDETGVPLVDLNISGETIDARDPSYVTSVNVAMGLIRKEYWLPNLILEADVLISVPVLKNHYLAGITLGMKNMIGMAPNDIYHAPGEVCEKKELSHADVELHQHIVDLNLARKPDYVVVDGLRGMTDGPIGSEIIDPPMRLIIAGRDVVAVDTVGTLIMGYDPASVPYLQMAEQSNLGNADAAWIQIVGESVTRVRRYFPAPYGELPVMQAESKPPLVEITFPQDGVSLAEPSQVMVEAIDDMGLAKVELYIDDLLLGIDREPPYQFALEPYAHNTGLHTLRAVGYDEALNEGRDQITINFPSPEPTSTATSTSVPQATTTPCTMVTPTEPTMAPPPTVTMTSVTVSMEHFGATEEPVPQEAATPIAASRSTTLPDDALLLGLLLVIVISAVGVGIGSVLVAQRRPH